MKRLALLATVLGLFAAATPAGACAADDTCLNDPLLAPVTGQVWLDSDADGERDADESARIGGTVFADYNRDGVRQARETVATADADGGYVLPVDPRRLPEGTDAVLVRWSSGYDRGWEFDPQCLGGCVHEVRVAAGRTSAGPRFPVVRGASLQGTVWDDKNENGRRESGEDGAGQMRVFLDDNGNGKREASEPTSPATVPGGPYSLPIPTRYLAAGGNLPPVVVDQPAGVNCTAPADCVVTGLKANSRQTVVADFGVARPVVIFTHGYGGSRIACGDKTLWFNVYGGPDLLNLRLGADGENLRDEDNGGTVCSQNARVDGLVMDVGGMDIYGSSSEHFKAITWPGRHYDYVWDWRKDPKTAVKGLDALVDEARAKHGVSRVVLVGHSQGGLVMRHYVEDPAKAAKVSRAVTVGTPYWGAPKTILPLAAGIEVPWSSKMDALMSNYGLKMASRTLPGHFSLVPAFGYGPWLRVNGKPLDMAGVKGYMEQLGVQPHMYPDGAEQHGRVLDHFRDNGVDFHVIVGGGVATIGSIGIKHDLVPRLEVDWVSGDETVPQRSAEHDTPADRLHVVCGLTHVPITSAPETTTLMDEFLIRAEKMGKGSESCNWTAKELTVYYPDDLTPVVRASQAKAQPRVIVEGRAMSVDDAERAGHVQVIAFGGETKIVASGDVRVELPKGTAGVVRELSDRGASAPKHYVGTKPVAKDTKAPVTTAKWRGGKLVLKAKDASKVAATFVVIGGKQRVYKRPLKLSAKQRKGAKYGSVDVWGNAERERPIRSS
ncbi:alpha/beta fold hydrolase [Solirubrobacter taibaiensis]|nr:alpha/beta fold hydrolase [Solirubrobacter taibaiensis]